jgi:hypothetical protein
MASQVLSLSTTFSRGFPVTKESAEKIYCGLDKNWWKQLYDGKFHLLGPEVFDKGLHGNGAEPGFYESALNAFEFVKRHLNEKLSVDFYCDLHKVACAHFKGKENRTQLEARDAGRFRPVGRRVKCALQLHTILKVFDKKNDREGVIREYCILRKHYGDEIVKICADGTTLKDKDKWGREFTITAAQAQEMEDLIQKKFQTLKETLNQCSNDPIIKNSIPQIALIEDTLRIDYSRSGRDQNNLYVVIPQLFDAFNRAVSEINQELINTSPSEREKIDSLVERKLVLIDNLYQNLEWLHPYPDGQGRTDLLLLAKLLCENGFTPAILHEPYMSSFSSRQEWLAYLKEGMQKWEEERKKTIADF